MINVGVIDKGVGPAVSLTAYDVDPDTLVPGTLVIDLGAGQANALAALLLTAILRVDGGATS